MKTLFSNQETTLDIFETLTNDELAMVKGGHRPLDNCIDEDQRGDYVDGVF